MICENCLIYSLCQHKPLWDAINQCELLRAFMRDFSLKHPGASVFRRSWQDSLKEIRNSEYYL